MTTRMLPVYPSLAAIHRLMDTIDDESIEIFTASVRTKGRLLANPVVNALQAIWTKLREATDSVVLNGKDAFEEAFKSVMREYEQWREKLGERAKEMLNDLSQRMFRLMQENLNLITQQFPRKLGLNWSNEIDSITTEYTISITPSFEVALHRWLTIAGTGSMKVTVKYAKRETPKRRVRP